MAIALITRDLKKNPSLIPEKKYSDAKKALADAYAYLSKHPACEKAVWMNIYASENTYAKDRPRITYLVYWKNVDGKKMIVFTGLGSTSVRTLNQNGSPGPLLDHYWVMSPRGARIIGEFHCLKGKSPVSGTYMGIGKKWDYTGMQRLTGKEKIEQNKSILIDPAKALR